jgi:hypothetical protein
MQILYNLFFCITFGAFDESKEKEYVYVTWKILLQVYNYMCDFNLGCIKYPLSAYYVPGIILESETTAVNKTHSLYSQGNYILVGGEIKQISDSKTCLQGYRPQWNKMWECDKGASLDWMVGGNLMERDLYTEIWRL